MSSTTLSGQIQIIQHARTIIENSFIPPELRKSLDAGLNDAGSTIAALNLSGQEGLVERVAKLEEALKQISDWSLPSTGQFWDGDKARPMSYGACYGSNGERDYFKKIATRALNDH